MYCIQCGTSLPENARYCRACGATQVDSTESPTLQSPRSPDEPISGQKAAEPSQPAGTYLTTLQVAKLCGVAESVVIEAIRDQRLRARMTNDTWGVAPEDARAFCAEAPDSAKAGCLGRFGRTGKLLIVGLIGIINLFASISALITAFQTDQFRLIGLGLAIINVLLFAYVVVRIGSRGKETEAASRQQDSGADWGRGSDRMGMGKFSLMALACAAGTFAVVVQSGGGTDGSPQLISAKSAVPRGDVIRIEGRDFPPDAPVDVAMTSERRSGGKDLSDPVTDSDGNFIMLIATGDLAPGSYQITASAKEATRSLTVDITEQATRTPTVPPAQPPTWTAVPIVIRDTPVPTAPPLPSHTPTESPSATATLAPPSPTNTPCDVDGCPDPPTIPDFNQGETADPNQQFALPAAPPTNTPCDVDGCPDPPVVPNFNQGEAADPNQVVAPSSAGEATVESVVE